MQNKLKTARRLSELLLCATVAGSALAQQPPETTGDPRQRPAAVQAPAPATAPVARKSPAPPGAEQKTLTVSRFVFNGNTVFKSEELAALVAGYTGKPVTLAQVFEAADKVAEKYVAAGYTLASVTLPAQKIADGTVQLEVIEGRLAAVNVEGNQRYRSDQIARQLGVFTPGQLYRGADIESGLYRVNAMPGLTARAVLQPGNSYGSSDLLIKVQEQSWTASLAGDNYGREQLGEYRGSLSATLNNPFRAADQLQAVLMNTQGGRLQYYYIGYSLPFGTTGLRLGLSHGQGEFGLAGVPVQGKNQTTRASLDYLFADSRFDTLGVGFGAVKTKANADLVGQQISESDITLFELSGFHNHLFGNRAASQTSLVLSSDLGQGEETPDPSARTKQDLRAELDVQFLYPLRERLSAYVHGNVVHSADPLPQVTHASLGGPNSVRAYPAAEVRGDRSLFGSMGVRQALNSGRAEWGLRAFVEGGQVTDLAEPNGQPEYRETLSGAGIGLDFGMPVGSSRISAKADWSVPLDNHNDSFGSGGQHDASTDDNQRLFATVSVSY